MHYGFRILALVAALWATSAHAADNAVIVTPGSGVTIRSVDVGSGVQAPGHALVDATGGQLGIVGSPLYIRAASGFVASGAFASGSLAAGAHVDLLTMRGTVAAGTAASNSLLTGCVYNSTPITLTNGQGSATQCSANGYPTVVVSNTNANGQATMANSSPVTIASNQTSIPVTIASGGVASGAVASGAVASGAFASGSIATGAMVDFLTTVGSKNAGTAAASAQLGAGVYNSTPLTLTNTQQASLQADVSGYLKIRKADGTKNAVIDPCEAALQTSAPISITTATTTRIVTPSASNKTYICALFLTSAAADNVGIVEGTGGTCGSGTAGVIGGTTAANGPNFAANGGLFLQAGGKVAVAQTAGTNVDLCLITSAATPLAGVIKYVQAP